MVESPTDCILLGKPSAFLSGCQVKELIFSTRLGVELDGWWFDVLINVKSPQAWRWGQPPPSAGFRMGVWQGCRVSRCFPALPRTPRAPPYSANGLWVRIELVFLSASPVLCMCVSWLGGCSQPWKWFLLSAYIGRPHPPLQTSALKLHKPISSFLVTLKENRILCVFPIFSHGYFRSQGFPPSSMF